MDRVWFKECDTLQNFESVEQWLSYPHTQAEYYKICITLGQVAAAIESSKMRFTAPVSPATVYVHGNLVNLCNSDFSLEASQTETNGYLRDLAKVAERLARDIKNPQMPKKLTGKVADFQKFSSAALELFKRG